MFTAGTSEKPVFFEHVFLGGMGDSRRRCQNCNRHLYYEGSVRWANGDQANFYACDCERDGERRAVTMTRCEEWNPFGEVAS